MKTREILEKILDLIRINTLLCESLNMVIKIVEDDGKLLRQLKQVHKP